jgi:excisionase family DNA binding protein
VDTTQTGGLPSGREGEGVLRQDGGLTLSVSPTEAARALGMSVRAIYYLANSGELPMVKVGRMTRFIVEDLQAFLQANRVQAAPRATPPTVPHWQGPRWYVPSGPSLKLKQADNRRVGVAVVQRCDATYIASLPPKPPRRRTGMSVGTHAPEVT